MPFEVDGMAPSSVLRPRTLTELAKMVAEADAARSAVIPWGGGTRMHVGNIPAVYDVALDISGLPVSIEHAAGDMVCVVSSSATVDAVQEELARSGQRLPFDVPNSAVATIGGSLASNAPGRMRSSFGGIRDWIIGMRTMSPDGTITKSGGRVVKNVQGFDLHRLHVGALGTLGIITEVGFKLVPITKAQATFAAWFEDLNAARQYAMSLFNGPTMPEALTLVMGPIASKLTKPLAADVAQHGTPYLVLTKATGVDTAVDRTIDIFAGLAGTASATGYLTLESIAANEAWTQVSSAEESFDLAVRTALRPTLTFDLIGRLKRVIERLDGVEFSAIVDVGFGGAQIGFTINDDASLSSCIRALEQAFTALDSSYSIERLPAHQKHDRDVFVKFGANIETMKRLKAGFDPNGTLNRGRYAGGI